MTKINFYSKFLLNLLSLNLDLTVSNEFIFLCQESDEHFYVKESECAAGQAETNIGMERVILLPLLLLY